jgi:DNA helicase-2/ATP-dependent DNA helicase PcrA
MLFGQTRYNRPSRFLRDLPQDDLKMHASSRQAFVPRGWGSAPASSAFQRVPFVHPQALPHRSSAPPSPSRAPGERFVEIDPEIAHENLRRGKHVRHKKFGEGRVIEILEGGVEPKVVASFPGWGTMTVLQRFLEIVD